MSFCGHHLALLYFNFHSHAFPPFFSKLNLSKQQAYKLMMGSWKAEWRYLVLLNILLGPSISDVCFYLVWVVIVSYSCRCLLISFGYKMLQHSFPVGSKQVI